MSQPKRSNHPAIAAVKEVGTAAPKRLEKRHEVLGESLPGPMPETKTLDLVEKIPIVTEPKELAKFGSEHEQWGEGKQTRRQGGEAFQPYLRAVRAVK
jgi:hypothetical protein